MEQGRIGRLGGVCRQDTGIEDGAGSQRLCGAPPRLTFVGVTSMDDHLRVRMRVTAADRAGRVPLRVVGHLAAVPLKTDVYELML